MVLKFNTGLAEKRLMTNIIYLMLVQFVNYLLPLLLLPFLTRMLSIEDFGKVVLMYSVSMLALIVSEFGFNITGPYYVAKNSYNIDKINIFYNNALIIKFLISLIYCMAFFLINYFFDLYNFSLIELIGICILILVQSFQFSWYFQGVEKMKEITKASIFSKVFYFIGVIVTIPFFKNNISVMLLYILSQIILALFQQRYLRKERVFFKKKYIKFKEIRKIFMWNVSFFISRLAVVGYTMLNTMIVGIHDGIKMVAIYGIAEKIYQIALSLLSPMTQAFYPYMIKNKKFGLLGIFLIIGVIFLSIFCFILSYFDEILILMIFGEEYIKATEILNYFYFIIVLVFLSMNIGYPLLGAMGKLKSVNLSVYIGLLFFAFLMFFRDYSLEVLLENIIMTEILVFCVRLYFLLISIKFWKFFKV